MSILIKGGTIVNPSEIKSLQADILVENEKIVDIKPDLNISGAEVIDATDFYIFPGFIDLHTHLREPGKEGKETIATGTAAAVAGGFTAVTAMPNTTPPCDNSVIIEYILSKAREANLARVYPVGCITKQQKGEEIAELGKMAAAGAVAFSDDGSGVDNAEVMRCALSYGNMLRKPFLLHCEDKNLAADGVMHDGYNSTVLGLKGIPALAEEIMMQRDIYLAAATDTQIHICHLSTAGSVKILSRAKQDGIKVTAEVTPHHFTLTDNDINGYDTNTKVNPPLRSENDIKAIKEAISSGLIDAIATDHAPHNLEEKNQEYNNAPFGIVGLETAASLVWTELVIPGLITPNKMAALMSKNPATILQIPGGCIEKGQPADLAVFDPKAEWVVDKKQLFTKSKNTPFHGRKLCGKVMYTLVNGRICYREGKIVR